MVARTPQSLPGRANHGGHGTGLDLRFIEASRGARVTVLGTSSINGAHQAASLARHVPWHQVGSEVLVYWCISLIGRLVECPLSGVKRTSQTLALMSAFDPKRTSSHFARISPTGSQDDPFARLCPGLRCALSRSDAGLRAPDSDLETGTASRGRAPMVRCKRQETSYCAS